MKILKSIPNVAYIFDVDGVLADPKHKKVDEDLLHMILDKLKSGEPVALNTGRSIDWVNERIIAPLSEQIEDKNIISRFFVIGEKGGTWMCFDDNCNIKRNKEESFVLSEDLREKVKNLVEAKYSDCAFFDETKETMISVEMKDAFEIPEFSKRQKDINAELKALLEEAIDGHRIEPSIIATDIQDKRAGKALGTDRFIHFLEERNIHPEKFIAFGDSPSDLDMADELHKQGKQVDFVFVGDQEKLGDVKRDFHIAFMEGFHHGTKRYLEERV